MSRQENANLSKVVIIHNIISPFKTSLFNELFKIHIKINILYIRDTESNREWIIDKDNMAFPFEILNKGDTKFQNRLNLIITTWKKLNIYYPDIVVLGGYGYVVYWAGFFWAKMHKKKLILWSASNKEDKDRNLLKERLKAFMIKRFDAANTYGTKSKKYLIQLGMNSNDIFIKGNTTDNTFYFRETMRFRTIKNDLCKEFGIPQNNFLFIGRFSPEKNVISLLDAFKKLKNKHIHWGLILVGNGPLKKEYTNYIKKRNIIDVFLPGFKQSVEIPRYFAVSDLFILPSISEAWGLVVNEAMAAGLPILVSKNCGCYPDLVNEGVNGFSFDPYNSNELLRLMTDAATGKYDLEVMGRGSLEIIKEFTPENAAKVVKRTFEFVSSLR